VTERRWDPTTGEWRTVTTPVAGDGCPLCLDGAAYEIAVLDSPVPGRSASPPQPSVAGTALSPVLPAYGASEVVLHSGRHDVTLADLGVDRLARLVDVWADRYAVLGARDEVAYVLVAEEVGGSAGHPHGRVAGYPDLPPRARLELDAGQRHLAQRGTCVWCDLVGQERADGLRVVGANGHWLAFVPFAARVPYEVQVAPLRHAPSLLDLSDPERQALAELLHRVLAGYGSLVGAPYAVVLHQAPTDDGPWLPVSHLHVELAPLLRGTALGVGAGVDDSDVAPEDAAARLREVLARG
jgi:UDPglucose--hexose-1-phosphate uridylyltransferase